ncbi:NADH dehydrogenase [ubiquinone] iron-sulfur protein 6, mitochondrial isoform X1 [Zalophus californianus]|uniref:NADH dehydrogenase [ubiquinone] iron-sulfur protein 6, mitochondrial isoform X1 n=1 Tax=Zalophus californianus TaxID=9704 RepID=A0A6J2E6F9_ZALCA|nr:NADH dehydrogenase [ubiquinone] iron-sulfur protein 6, mitochondrial isoform X1 [Zalophus californianus]
MRQRVGAPGQGSVHKMAAAVTFCRLLGRRGTAALNPPRGARCLAVRTSPTGEKITHTGQVYDDKDYRKIRFVGRQKEETSQGGHAGFCSDPPTPCSPPTPAVLKQVADMVPLNRVPQCIWIPRRC